MEDDTVAIDETSAQSENPDPSGNKGDETLLALRGKKIVIVEDDSFLHNLLADKLKELREEGVEVHPTFNGEEALAVARKVLPDIILLDIMLPGMNGFEVLKVLRDDPNLRNTPVIILSNLGQEDDMKRARELGVTDYQVKANLTLEDLVQKIASLLKKT